MENNKLQKSQALPLADVGIDEPVLTDEQAIAILSRSTGLTQLPKDAVTGLASLGIYSRGVGVLRKQRGEVLVNQAWLGQTLKILTQRLADEHARGAKARQSVIRGIAHEIGSLSSVFRGWVDTSLELEKAAVSTGKSGEIDDRPRNTGFGTGTVIAAKEVHVHEAPATLPPTSASGG